jgi:hypothetical protein
MGQIAAFFGGPGLNLARKRKRRQARKKLKLTHVKQTFVQVFGETETVDDFFVLETAGIFAATAQHPPSSYDRECSAPARLQ